MLGAAVIFAVAVLGPRIQCFLPRVRLTTRQEAWLACGMQCNAMLQAIEPQRLVDAALHSFMGVLHAAYDVMEGSSADGGSSTRAALQRPSGWGESHLYASGRGGSSCMVS